MVAKSSDKNSKFHIIKCLNFKNVSKIFWKPKSVEARPLWLLQFLRQVGMTKYCEWSVETILIAVNLWISYMHLLKDCSQFYQLDSHFQNCTLLVDSVWKSFKAIISVNLTLKMGRYRLKEYWCIMSKVSRYGDTSLLKSIRSSSIYVYRY